MMDIEQTLTDELRTVAGGLETPPPPSLETLVRTAERARVRTRRRVAGTALLTAAAVLAVVLAGSRIGKPSGSPNPAPQPTETPPSLKVGDPLKTYVDPTSATLYLDGVAVDGRWTAATTTGDVTTATAGSNDDLLAVFLGTSRIGTLHWVLDQQVLVSSDERRIAWVEDHDTTSIVVAEVGRAEVRELGRLPLDTLVREPDVEGRESLLAVRDDGTVVYGGVTGGHTWKPGGTPRSADISAYLYRPGGFPEQVDDLRLNHEGTWGAWLTGENDPGGDGALTFRAVTVQHRAQPGTRARLTMPAALATVTNLYWESETDVVLTIGDGAAYTTEYVRCDVVRRSCRLAPGWGAH